MVVLLGEHRRALRCDGAGASRCPSPHSAVETGLQSGKRRIVSLLNGLKN
jgi:hypothetical protein